MGPCIVNIFQYISNKMQLYTVCLYPETALHVSGGTSTHRQERIQLYLQHLVFVRLLLLPAVIAAGSSNSLTNTRYQFLDINKLCKVASFWMYIEIPLIILNFSSRQTANMLQSVSYVISLTTAPL